MTGSRVRLGWLTAALIALLCIALVGIRAVDRSAADGPSEIARAGLPVGAADMSLDDPELDEEREEQGEGAETRVEAFEAATKAGTAGQSGARASGSSSWRRSRKGSS